MKKDKEWLKDELEREIKKNDEALQIYNTSYIKGVKHAYDACLMLVEELEDSSESAIPEDYELLSEDWIEKHKHRDESIMLPTEPPKYVEFINVSDLSNLLVPKQELEKVKIPQFVADWTKECRQRGLGIYDLLNYEHSTCMPESVKEYIRFNFSKLGCGRKEQELLARAWINGYEIEEELYTVTLANGEHLVKLGDGSIGFSVVTNGKGLTKAEIESVDPILMGIAKPVEMKG